eukprot:2052428-Lingulodinium_polyedra.AAC.1
MLSTTGGKDLGFVSGAQGLFGKLCVELTPELFEAYKGTGGFELLDRTVDRVECKDELKLAWDACTELDLTGLVLVAG